jgi:hypothetical protein
MPIYERYKLAITNGFSFPPSTFSPIALNPPKTVIGISPFVLLKVNLVSFVA